MQRALRATRSAYDGSMLLYRARLRTSAFHASSMAWKSANPQSKENSREADGELEVIEVTETEVKPVKRSRKKSTKGEKAPQPNVEKLDESVEGLPPIEIASDKISVEESKIDGSLPLDTMVYDDGSIYTGDLRNGLRDGTGVLTYEDGSFYQGGWHADKMDGQGTLVYMNENRVVGRFEGNFFRGKIVDGKGLYKMPFEGFYDGEVEMGKMHGRGTYHRDNGEKCIGQWVNGEFAGPQVVTPKYSYTGQFENGVFHGKGVMEFSNGVTYSGQFVNGKMCGLGKLTSATGDVYDGNFLENKRHGYGLQKYKPPIKVFKLRQVVNNQFAFVRKAVKPMTAEYAGEWAEGRRHGLGMMKYADGTTFKGSYKEGKVWSGEGVLTSDYEKNALSNFKREMRFEGTFVDGKPNGKGSVKTPRSLLEVTFDASGKFEFGKETFYEVADDGTEQPDSVYEGHYRNDQRSGYGTQSFSNKESIQGEWRRGKPYNMKGTIYTNFCKAYTSGTWVDGEKKGTFDSLYVDLSRFQGEHFGQGVKVGKQTFFDGSITEGKFINLQPTGKHIYTAAPSAGGRKEERVYDKGKIIMRKPLNSDGSTRSNSDDSKDSADNNHSGDDEASNDGDASYDGDGASDAGDGNAKSE